MSQAHPLEDRDSFARLFVSHGEQAFRYARMMGLPEADAEDVVAESFSRAWTDRLSFRGDAQPGTWIIRVVRNQTLNWLRGEKRRRQRDEGAESVARRSRCDDPAASCEEAEMMAVVAAAVNSLPEHLRSALSLVTACGLSYREAAELECVTETAMGSRVFEARKAARDALAARGMLEV